MLKINDYNKLNIINVGEVNFEYTIYFQYNNKDFLLIIDYDDGVNFTLCSGKEKECSKIIAERYFCYNQYDTKVIKYNGDNIDKEHFVLTLVKYGMLEPNEEQKKKVMDEVYQKCIREMSVYLHASIFNFHSHNEDKNYYYFIDTEQFFIDLKKNVGEIENPKSKKI